jgi:hypothetical protein
MTRDYRDYLEDILTSIDELKGHFFLIVDQAAVF